MILCSHGPHLSALETGVIHRLSGFTLLFTCTVCDELRCVAEQYPELRENAFVERQLSDAAAVATG